MKINNDVRILGSYAYHISFDGNILGMMREGPISRDEFRHFLQNNLPIAVNASSALMHKQTIIQVGGYRSKFLQSEDIDLWNRVAEQGALILKIPKPLVKTRIHALSISASSYWEQRIMYRWCRECMMFRRSGLPEPSLENYLQDRKKKKLLLINEFRKDTAKYLYKKAGLNYAYKNYIRLLLYLVGSAILQPCYAAKRLYVQTHGLK